MKRRLSFLYIAMFLMFVLLSGSAMAATSGSSDGVSWTFDDNGTVIFSGTGKIPGIFTWGEINGQSELEKVKSVIIQDGITGLGMNAIANCVNLTSVTIPNSVTLIDNTAFFGCTSLTSITIPDSVSDMGLGVFRDCTSLKSINLSNSITIIHGNTFENCRSLQNVIIPNSVTSIGVGAFYACGSLTNITIPDNVTNIGNAAFSNCGNLKKITIPISVTNIGNDAFYNCKGLKNVYYAGTQNDWKNIIIGEDNEYLTNATIHFSSKSNNNINTNNSNIKIMLNGKPLSFSQAPYMANDTTMVPMRAIFEALGAAVEYDADSQKITATKGDIVIELVLGEKAAKKNGEGIALDAPAVTKNGNTMVPLRFVAEALQAQVDWDGVTQTISITLE